MRRSRVVLGLVLTFGLAFCTVAATCSKGAPPPTARHQAVAALEALTASLTVTQDTVRLFRATRPCEKVEAPCISADKYQKFGAAMTHVWDYDRDAVLVVKSLKPGDPVPIQVGNLVVAIRATLRDVLGDVGLDVMTQTKVLAVYDAVAVLLAALSPLLL